MSLEIAKPQTGQLPKVKGPEMNDRDRINDILAQQKYLSYGYNTGLHEMQNPKLHKEIESILTDVNKTHDQLFNLMFEKGWYKMKVADQQEISKVQQQFANYSTQFPKF